MCNNKLLVFFLFAPVWHCWLCMMIRIRLHVSSRGGGSEASGGGSFMRFFARDSDKKRSASGSALHTYITGGQLPAATQPHEAYLPHVRGVA